MNRWQTGGSSLIGVASFVRNPLGTIPPECCFGSKLLPAIGFIHAFLRIFDQAPALVIDSVYDAVIGKRKNHPTAISIEREAAPVHGRKI
jgi:hypothetical protein